MARRSRGREGKGCVKGFMVGLAILSGGVRRLVMYFSGDDLFTPIERPYGLPMGNLMSPIWPTSCAPPSIPCSRRSWGSVRSCDTATICSSFTTTWGRYALPGMLSAGGVRRWCSACTLWIDSLGILP